MSINGARRPISSAFDCYGLGTGDPHSAPVTRTTVLSAEAHLLPIEEDHSSNRVGRSHGEARVL